MIIVGIFDGEGTELANIENSHFARTSILILKCTAVHYSVFLIIIKLLHHKTPQTAHTYRKPVKGCLFGLTYVRVSNPIFHSCKRSMPIARATPTNIAMTSHDKISRAALPRCCIVERAGLPVVNRDFQNSSVHCQNFK